MSIILFNPVIDMLDIWIGTKLLFYIDHHSFHPYFDMSTSQNVRSADSDEQLYHFSQEDSFLKEREVSRWEMNWLRTRDGRKPS